MESTNTLPFSYPSSLADDMNILIHSVSNVQMNSPIRTQPLHSLATDQEQELQQQVQVDQSHGEQQQPDPLVLESIMAMLRSNVDSSVVRAQLEQLLAYYTLGERLLEIGNVGFEVFS